MQRTIKYDVLSTELNEAKELRLKLGDAGDDNGGVCADVAAWGVAGVICRPADKDQNGTKGVCQALLAIDGSDRRVVAMKDNRLNERYGELAPGDAAVVTIGKARLLVKADNDSASIITENKANGGTMAIQADGSTGMISTLVSGPGGATVINQTDSKIVLGVNGGAQIVLSGNKITLVANEIKAQGNCLLGIFPPAYVPTVALDGAAKGPGTPTNVPSASVMLGS